jgi:hypothetical protein
MIEDSWLKVLAMLPEKGLSLLIRVFDMKLLASISY